jgi:hypothetical protein
LVESQFSFTQSNINELRSEVSKLSLSMAGRQMYSTN